MEITFREKIIKIIHPGYKHDGTYFDCCEKTEEQADLILALPELQTGYVEYITDSDKQKLALFDEMAAALDSMLFEEDPNILSAREVLAKVKALEGAVPGK